MIGSLHGIVELIDGITVFVNVNGVGYRVNVPRSVLTQFHKLQKIDLYIYSHIREDLFDLYGFIDIQDLKLFEALLDVSGIGPKTALGIFSAGSREQILIAIQKADVNFFSGIPRLGKKNAQKIIIELKGKLGSINELNLSGNESDEDYQVITALKSFGFNQKEAVDALRSTGEEKDVSSRVRAALKYLGK